MKTNHTPWPAIRWLAAAVLYILTLAIAWDQIQIRDRKIEEKRALGEKIQVEMRRIQRDIERDSAEMQAVLLLAEENQRNNDKMGKDLELLGTLLERKRKIDETRRLLDEAQGKSAAP